jgi:hypothetical protein
MKNKNPLYVVKGKDVLEASSVIDLVIKKFNLEPLITVMKNILNLLMSQVETYAWYVAVKKVFDEMMNKIRDLGKMTGLISA